jgi:hypothetical protein
MLDFREAPGGSLPATPVAYSQKQHFAWSAMVGAVWAELRMVIARAKEKRQDIEDQMAADRRLFSEILKRITDLERKPSLSYEGTYSADKAYVVGNFITHDGSLWHCQMPSQGIEPGHAPAHYKLAVKRGRDSKESAK